MTKRFKIALAAAATVVSLGGMVPAAHAEQKSVGTTAYEQVVTVTQTTAGRVIVRLLDRGATTARP